MYNGVFTIFDRYWRAYGGRQALLRSPYLHVALLLLIVTSHYWLYEKWWEQPLSILPNLLGFSLGGLAMFLSFGNEKFRSELTVVKDVTTVSPYLALCSTFVHFIVLQLLALISALIARSFDFVFDWPQSIRQLVTFATAGFYGVGYLLFLYSVISMLAATMAVFRICTWYEIHQRVEKSAEE
jgi:hypothetical protein